MLVFKRLTALAVMIFAILAGGGAALAEFGQPSPWQLGMQQAATPVMDNIIWFHDYLLYFIGAITLFVLAAEILAAAIGKGDAPAGLLLLPSLRRQRRTRGSGEWVCGGGELQADGKG